jgi:diguanylate cyclase
MSKQISHSNAKNSMTDNINDLFSRLRVKETSKIPFSPSLQLHTSELMGLKQALAASNNRLQVAEKQIEKLHNTNARFQQKLILLAKKFMLAKHDAYHDELTGLPNRSFLLDRLKQAMVQSVRQHTQVALLFIDLDRFKNVNDRFGHLVGDQLLQHVAKRLAYCVRRGDTVCRYGGDEFVIILTDINAQESAAKLTEKILTRLSASYALCDHIVEITASVGIAVYQAEGQNSHDLINKADIAMYLAKLSR